MSFVHKDLQNPHYVEWADFLSGADEWSLARIEEEVVVTPDGPRILTLFPSKELVIANPY